MSWNLRLMFILATVALLAGWLGMRASNRELDRAAPNAQGVSG